MFSTPNPLKPLATVCVVMAAASSSFAQDHGHLNIGAETHQQGSRLLFENGADFIPSTGYVKTLTMATSGKYSRRYNGNITLTALHAVDAFGEPVPNSSAPGSFIVAEIVSVAGPEGGAFQFWDATSTTEPTFSISTGTTDAQKIWEVSDASLGAGQPEGDPYGHIHGRRFTATLPGVYTVGFRAHDRSGNGINNGPIHQSSDIVEVRFQAGFNILGVSLKDFGAEVQFVATAGFSWQLEAKDNIAEGNWVAIGDPITGTDKIATQIDPGAPIQSRMYRIQGTPVQ